MAHVVCVEGRIDGVWLPWNAGGIHRGRFAVRVGDTNRARERIHGVDYQVTFPDALIADFLQCGRKAFCPTIAAQRDLAIAKACDDVVLWSDAAVHPLEQPFCSLNVPGAGDAADPVNAAVLVGFVRSEPQPLHHSTSDSAATGTPRMSEISPSACCSSVRISAVTSSRPRRGLWR